MSWRIVNGIHTTIYDFKDSKTLSIGFHEDCEIKIQTLKTRSIHSQVILDDGFLFHVFNNQTNVYFLNSELKIENSFVTLEWISEYNFERKYLPIDDNEIQTIFSSDDFLNLLSHVQKSFFEFHKFNFEMRKISISEIVNHASKILLKTIFLNCSIFEESTRKKFKQILWCLWAQIFEYGVLTPAILNSEISEIMVNGYNNVYFEKFGKIIPASIQFKNENNLLSLIERICSTIGRRIDESMPYCDARLKEGHRVHAIIPPLSLVGPCLTIRKFPNFSFDLKKLIKQRSLTQTSAEILKEAIRNKKNIVISGGTGSGKTTLLNCLSAFIPKDERILTIEDSAELQLQQPHIIRLECRNENIENLGKVTIRDLLKNALRMRPDRIIVGECRGAEAIDMLQAMNTGHDGSMTTVHANSPQDALRRLETLVLFSELDLPSRVIREQLSSAIHFIVQQSRLSCGKRAVTQIEKVIGFDEKNASIKTERIYSYEI